MGNKAEEKLKEALREALEQQIERVPAKEQIKEIHILPDSLYEQVKPEQRKKGISFYRGIKVAACLSAAVGMLYAGNVFLDSVGNKSSHNMEDSMDAAGNAEWNETDEGGREESAAEERREEESSSGESAIHEGMETNVRWSMEFQEGYLTETYLKMQVELPKGVQEASYGPILRVEWKQGAEWKTVYEKEEWEEQILKGGERKEEKLVFSEYGIRKEGCYRLSRMIEDKRQETIITIRKER